MELVGNIQSFYPEDGEEAERAIRQAHSDEGPNFISLKSDPLLGASITEKN